MDHILTFQMGKGKQAQAQISRLSQELSRCETAKAEALGRTDELEKEVACLTEETRTAVQSKNFLLEESREFRDSRAEKLRDLREDERKLEEKFLIELSAQTRLVHFYKCLSEEHNTKVEDLGHGVTNLVELLKESNIKQEDIIKAHNWALIDHLEDVKKLVTEITASGLNGIVKEG